MSRFKSSRSNAGWQICLLLLIACGCDKIPTASELTSPKPAPAPTTPTSQPSLPPETPTQVAETPKTAEEIIAEFRAMEPKDIDDKALTAVANLPEAVVVFETLDLANSRVTDQGVQTLQQLTNLKELNLANCQVRGQSLAALKSLEQLEILTLDSTPFDSTTAPRSKIFQR